MFGIDQISWGEFTCFIGLTLLAWYTGILLYAFVRGKRKDRETLYEAGGSKPFALEPPDKISVSSKDFPADMIPWHVTESLPLSFSLYEENHLDSGYALERFQDPENSLPDKVIGQIQIQQ